MRSPCIHMVSAWCCVNRLTLGQLATDLKSNQITAMLAMVRGHWLVENQLHWSLDVAFGEDGSRVRMGHAAEHLSRIRRIALALLKRETTFKAGIKRKRLRCALDHPYLLKVINA